MSDAKELLRELMDALNDEARARASASVAEDNFTDPSPDEDKLFRATLRAAKAIAAANAFLAQPAASAEDVREDLNSALSYCGGAMQYASHHCQNIVGDISAIRQQIERALSKINAAPQVNGLQIDRVWIDEHPESGAAPGVPEEPFWWWASGSVSRHEPDRDYEVVEKRDYDKLRAHAEALQSKLSAAYAAVRDLNLALSHSSPYGSDVQSMRSIVRQKHKATIAAAGEGK